MFLQDTFFILKNLLYQAVFRKCPLFSIFYISAFQFLFLFFFNERVHVEHRKYFFYPNKHKQLISNLYIQNYSTVKHSRFIIWLSIFLLHNMSLINQTHSDKNILLLF